MSWNTRFEFVFTSRNSAEYEIFIQQQNYEGDVIRRPLGRAPVLRKKKNGPICATSLELYAECQVDGEFSVLYTSDPQEYRVLVRRDAVEIWRGFVCPELYSEPDIAPPYDVQIIATDGLGELKLYDFTAQGAKKLGAHIKWLLDKTGHSDIQYYASTLNWVDYEDDPYKLINWYINIDHLEGKTCYDVLLYILNSLNATITYYEIGWLIARERDLKDLYYGTKKVTLFAADGGNVISQSFYLDNAIESYGQRGRATLWPIGNLVTTIVPAKNRVQLVAPWELFPALQDKTMEDQSSYYWKTYQSDKASGNGYWVGNNLTSGIGQIYQIISMNYIDSGFKVKVFARASNTQGVDVNGWVKIYLRYKHGNVTRFGTSHGWYNTAENLDEFSLGRVEIAGPMVECSIDVPRYEDATAGELRLIIEGFNAFVGSADMEFDKEGGFEDTIVIDNNARSPEDKIEILGSRVTSRGLENGEWYRNYWMVFYNGTAMKSFISWTQITASAAGLDFLAFMALERAWSVAWVRKKIEGILNVPQSLEFLPMAVSNINVFGVPNRVVYWIETFDWDLYNDEVKITAISIPQGYVSVESETILPIKKN